MTKRALKVRRLGLIDYAEALKLQKETEQAVIAKTAPDTLFLLEHPHTFTLGRRARMDGVLATADNLKMLGARVYETNRGGKVTYHGIGQIVGYPIINLSPDREDVHQYVRHLEEVLIGVLRDFGIESFRIQGLTGVHTTGGKVAAIGIHIKRWVTTHGFALNVNTDLSFFDRIIACEGEPVASMENLLGREISLAAAEDKIIKNFCEVFDFRKIEEQEMAVQTA